MENNLTAADLRVGNLFYYGDRIAEISSIYRTHFVCEEYKTRIVFGNSIQNNFQPIPLTEEWLIKFGFEKLTTKSDNGYKASIFSYRKGYSFIVYFDDGILSVSFWQGNEKRYVHELQNLFYALTNTELTIKEDNQ